MNRVKVAGQHLLTLINDVLDIAKVEAGQMPMNRTTFDVPPLIEEVGSLAEPLIRKSSGAVEFSIDVDIDLPSLISDREKVKQILVNLLSNAIKVTKDGHVRMVVQEDNGYLQFSIEDSGVGIKEAEIHKIFEKFYQAGAIHQQGGTGLGLSLCKQFADLLGGVLGVRSVEGAGSTFTLSLPLLEPLHSPEDAKQLLERIKQRAAEVPSQSDVSRVMCVEDNPDNMLLLQDYLSDSGCHVIPVRFQNSAARKPL